MTFSVRRLGPDDAASYRDIRLEALAAEPVAFSSDVGREAGRPLAEWAAQLARNHSFGAFEEGILAGIATFFPEATSKTAHRGNVVGVYVKPAARGRGAGRALFEALIESARDRILQLHLSVAAENPAARRLYESIGFQLYGTVPRGLFVNGRYHDEYLMVLRLDEGGKKVTDR